jgi:uncharacterized membrane protein
MKFPSENLNTLTHFYRGEVQRATDWRRRLDRTTNWAILATTAAFSLTLGAAKEETTHIIFLFTSHLVFLLLWIEARRYRHYDVWHTRARMLEVHLLVPALHPEKDILQGDWREVLANDLLLPSYKISLLEALARRLNANYIWMFLGLLVAWVLRVYTEATERSAEGLYRACAYHDALPPWLVLFAQFGFWLVLLYILLRTHRTRNVTGEIRRREPRAKQWPI